MTLTEEQRNLLALMGEPEEYRQPHFVFNHHRIIRDLLGLGLVCYVGRDSSGCETFNLTDRGEGVYEELTGVRS